MGCAITKKNSFLKSCEGLLLISCKGLLCHPAYLAYMQGASYEMPGWIKHKLKSRLGDISITSDTQMIPPLWQKVKGD